MGRTGSGKTQFGAWLLSNVNFKKQPYVIIDYKRDDLLNEIDNVKEIDLKTIPKKNGLYKVHPRPDDEEEIEAFLWKIWERENIGVYIDEAYMIPKFSGAYSALLTQGRSKHIPMINLTQRPTYINRFVFTESDYYGVFHLNDRRDQKKVEEFLPGSIEKRLPDYHSRWFDVSKNKIFIMKPVPDRDTILQIFDDKLRPQPKKFYFI